MGEGRARMEGGSIKGICPVHLLDGCGLVLGRGGAEKIVGRGVWKERMCQRLVLERAGRIMVVLKFPLYRYKVARWLMQPNPTAEALVRIPGEDCLFPSFPTELACRNYGE